MSLSQDTPRSVHPSYGNGLQNTLPARDTDLDAPDSHDYQRQDCHYYQNVRYTERDYRGGNHTTQYGDNTDPARTHPIPAPRRTSQVLQAGAQGTNTVQQANGENMDAHISHIQTQPNWIGPGQPHPPFLAAQHLPPHNPTEIEYTPYQHSHAEPQTTPVSEGKGSGASYQLHLDEQRPESDSNGGQSLLEHLFNESQPHKNITACFTLALNSNEMMGEHSSYHQSIPGEEAIRRLRASGQPHCYLTRYSEASNSYVLSVYQRQRPKDVEKHFAIKIKDGKLNINGTTEYFGDIGQLLVFYEEKRIHPSLRNIGHEYREQTYIEAEQLQENQAAEGPPLEANGPVQDPPHDDDNWQHVDRPQDNRQHVDRPQDNRQHIDRPQDNRQHIDRPQDNRQHIDRPQDNMPRNEPPPPEGPEVVPDRQHRRPCSIL